MSEPRTVGVSPWFPWPLARWSWWTELVPAERVAALRVAAALAVLADIAFGYLPHFGALFSADALGGRDLYAGRFQSGHYFWSLFRVLPDSWGPRAVFAAWGLSAVGLLIGWRPLVCGLVCWACAVSVWAINPGPHNGGDRLRHTLLLMTAVSCSGAVWGVSSLRMNGDLTPVQVPGWPVKLLFVQLACLYFFSGYYKLLSPQWRSGYVMYWASHDLYWSLYPGTAARLPLWAHQLSAWVTLVWELGFPLLAVMRGTRAITLILGVIFHLGTLVTLEVGPFALYAIACYAAFAPWERLRQTPTPGPLPAERGVNVRDTSSTSANVTGVVNVHPVADAPGSPASAPPPPCREGAGGWVPQPHNPLAWLVGAFALWQVAFPVLANVWEFIPRRPTPTDDYPERSSTQRWGRFTDRDGLQGASERVGDALALYAEVTGLEQGWNMFTPDFPPHTVVPVAELRFAGGPPARVESRFSPADPDRPGLRWPLIHDREFNFEANITMLGWHADEATVRAKPAVWSKLPDRVRDSHELIVRWLRWKANAYRDANPHAGEVTEAVLIFRYIPTRLPDDPPDAPRRPTFERPFAKWYPGGSKSVRLLPLEGYDPVAGRFVPLNEVTSP